MEIIVSVEHSIYVDDDDTIGLNTVDEVLRNAGVTGDDINERIENLYAYDTSDALAALVALSEYAEVESHACVDFSLVTEGVQHPLTEALASGWEPRGPEDIR